MTRVAEKVRKSCLDPRAPRITQVIRPLPVNVYRVGARAPLSPSNPIHRGWIDHPEDKKLKSEEVAAGPAQPLADARTRE